MNPRMIAAAMNKDRIKLFISANRYEAMMDNVVMNPGTLKVEDIEGNILWGKK